MDSREAFIEWVLAGDRIISGEGWKVVAAELTDDQMPGDVVRRFEEVGLTYDDGQDEDPEVFTFAQAVRSVQEKVDSRLLVNFTFDQVADVEEIG